MTKKKDMDNKCSQSPEVAVNLKQLPPIHPLQVVNSSVKGKPNNSSARAAAKVVKPSFNPTLRHDVVEDASSISSIKESDTCGNTTTLTQTYSADEGMKKGSARSNLHEICAANHWKRPVFECCKEEGPCHRRMFTFKVIIEIDEASKNIIECYGAPNQKKKMAADHAAEGALCTAKASTATKLFHSSVMLSRLGCHCSEDHAFLGGPLFPVKSLFLFLVGVLLSQCC